MDDKLISNKTLIFRIVLSVLFVSVILIFISTQYIKKKAIDTLASDDAKKTAQLVFETMNARMSEGWGKEDLDKIIDRIEHIRKGMHIASYRSKQVEQMFGAIQSDKRIVDNDPMLQKVLRTGEEIFSIDDQTGMVRFLYPMKVQESCITCHQNTTQGSVNGVLDIQFPHSDIKISLDTMSIYFIGFFILFLLLLFYIVYVLITKKMVRPVLELTGQIQAIESNKNLETKVQIDSNIKEIRILQNSFNSLLHTIKYYYDMLIEKLYTDDLTNLHNFTKLQKDLDLFEDNQTLIIIDIKGFGKINRVYGVKVADVLLQKFTFVLQMLFIDNSKIYRLYGDEFAIIYDGVLEKNQIQKYVDRLKDEKFIYKDIEFTIDIRVGYTNKNSGNVFENANVALEVAKSKKVNIVGFSQDFAIKDEDNNHMYWLKKLENGIKNHLIVPVFMPMKNTKTGKIDKYETLVRLQEGETLHTPDKFLEVSIASGMYPIITQTVIKKAMEYFKNKPHLSFSINIALSDITNEETTLVLFEELDKFPYTYNVIIELLETEELNDFDLLNQFIQKVKTYNAKIAIDDFGSGYSNFNYLLNLDIDIVKLDSSLIENIFINQEAAVVVSNIVRVSKELNFEVVAEKVSDERIENILTIYEVDYLQGFYIGKPALEVLDEI
ncbi:MAG: EAL domain-containing protein [Campylobacterales bacterium]|nr:EAL domain-containing protein [Campylobacterales bacterium]